MLGVLTVAAAGFLPVIDLRACFSNGRLPMSSPIAAGRYASSMNAGDRYHEQTFAKDSA